MHEPAEGKCIITRSETVIDPPERFISRKYRQVCFKCFNSHRVPFAKDGSLN